MAAEAGQGTMPGPGQEVGALLRGKDWSATPLGPREGWPPGLRAIIGLILASPLPMLALWGPELVQLYNDGYAAILGAGHPSALGQPFRARRPETWPSMAPIFAAVLRGEARFVEAQKRILLRRGIPEEAWFDLTFSPLRDEAGSVAGILLTAVEATARVRAQAEASLRETEAAFCAAFDQSPVPMHETDCATGLIVRVNAAFCQLVGRRAEDLLGHPVSEATHPEDREANLAAFRRMARGEQASYEAEKRYLRPDGTIRWARFSSAMVRDASGRPLRTVAVAQDITERKEAEAALRESEARFRAMADDAPVMVWVTDPTGTSTFLGRSWYEFTGQTPETGLGFGWLDAIHPEDRGEVDRAFLAANARHEAFRLEYRLRRSDGEYRWAMDAAVPRFGEGGEFLGYIGSVIDITERKAAEEHQALLTREVNHRAKNALAVVQAAVRLTRAPDVPSYVRAVEGRVGALARAHTLLAQDRWAGADLRALLEGELAPFRGAGQRVSLEGPRVAVPASVAQPLGMAAHELATNAVKHGALSVPGGYVSVTWRLSGGPGGVLRLRWVETGGPPVQRPPVHRGFGSRVLEATLRGQLGGSVSLAWEEKGLICEMEVPLSRATDPGMATEG
ncbi:MAG: PAS domain S-box protein [Acetobacteraceae bacterium]|nr:PAS domain S-box protein [Acetobacteraceae bacterium]